MKLKDFLMYYKISHPDKMLSSPKYGDNKKEDMAYCSLRALFISMTSQQQPIISMVENNEISKFTNFIDNNGNILTPAEACRVKLVNSEIDFADTFFLELKMKYMILKMVKLIKKVSLFKQRKIGNI